MRPDEHKKKRSAQYNKKKGNTESKTKKGSESQSGKQQDRVGSDRSHVGAQQQQQHVNNSGVGEAEKEIFTKEEDRRTNFKRREIVSNWSRYEVTETGGDNLYEATDYSKLIKVSGTGGASSHFRFKDEAEWNESLSGGTDTPSVLGIDLNDLAQAVNCVPLFERLQLPPDFIPGNQREEMIETSLQCKKDYLEQSCCGGEERVIVSSYSLPEENYDVETPSSTNEPNILSSALTVEKQLSNDLSDQLDKINLDKGNTQDEKNERLLNNCEEKPSNCVTISEEQEEELDFLLSLGAEKNIDTGTTASCLDNSDSKAIETVSPPHSENTQAKKNSHQSSSPVSPPHSENPQTKENAHQSSSLNTAKSGSRPKKDDLEDWLDSILDD